MSFITCSKCRLQSMHLCAPKGKAGCGFFARAVAALNRSGSCASKRSPRRKSGSATQPSTRQAAVRPGRTRESRQPLRCCDAWETLSPKDVYKRQDMKSAPTRRALRVFHSALHWESRFSKGMAGQVRPTTTGAAASARATQNRLRRKWIYPYAPAYCHARPTLVHQQERHCLAIILSLIHI